MSWTDNTLFAKLERFLDLTAFRQQLVVSNMANVDTPRYHTRDIDFQTELRRADMQVSAEADPKVIEPSGLVQRPDGNNVNMDREGLVLARTQLEFRVAAQLLRKEFQQVLTAIKEGS